MPQIYEQNQTRDFPLQHKRDYLSVFDNGVYYPEQRTTEMGETSIHIKLLTEFWLSLAKSDEALTAAESEIENLKAEIERLKSQK